MTTKPFSARHYASTPVQKVRRALAAGPLYYLSALPRYYRRRRDLGLPLDALALTNPLHEFRPRTHHDYDPPPGLDEVYEQLGRAGVEMTMPRLRFEALAAVWWQVRSVPGDVIECGAYQGATGLALATLGLVNGVEKSILLLDTFEGLPESGVEDPHRRGGEFSMDSDQVDRIRAQADQLGVSGSIEIHVGLFADTFSRLGTRDQTFSLAHIDANIYQGTWEACRFAVPRIASGGAVVFDDYRGPFDLGARLAIDQYFHTRTERPKPLAWSSAVVFPGG